MVDLSVSIVTYNNSRTISATLDSLLALLPVEFSYVITVIDNGSTDETLEIVSRYQDRLILLCAEKGNIGFGAAHNRTLQNLDSRYHLIMNPDISLTNTQSIRCLVDCLDCQPDIGMVVPCIISPAGETQYLCRRQPTFLDLSIRFLPGYMMPKRQRFHTMQDQDYTQSFDVPFASGCFLMIRTELWCQLGGFDPRFFLYLEDADLTRRVNQVSRTIYIPDAVVIHQWERSSYKNVRHGLVHLASLFRYFQKWGWAFI